MWGNARGWTISAMAAVFWGITMVGLGVFGAASMPAGFGADRGALAELRLPVSTAAMGLGSSGDGTVPILDAAGLYLVQPDVYDAIAGSGSMSVKDAGESRPMVLLRQAAGMSGPGIFLGDPRQIVGYENHPAVLEALGTLGDGLIRIGMSEWPDQKEQAIKDLQAAHSLGSRLAGERMTLAELRTGAHLMSESAAELARMDKDHATEWNAEVADLSTLVKHVNDIAGQISTVDSRAIAMYAGDVFAFAAESSERMWRVEAVLSMGRMRFNIGNGRRADQLAAKRLIDEYATDADPVVALAAREARDLTVEEYRVIGG